MDFRVKGAFESHLCPLVALLLVSVSKCITSLGFFIFLYKFQSDINLMGLLLLGMATI